MVVLHLEGGDVIWTGGKDNIYRGKEEYKAIILQEFDHHYFE